MVTRANGLLAACLILTAALHAAPAAAECRQFSSSELRTLVIRNTIKVGVTADHLERAWGEPTKIRHNSTGQVWEYWNPAGDELVEIGIDGCVKGWRTVRD